MLNSTKDELCLMKWALHRKVNEAFLCTLSVNFLHFITFVDLENLIETHVGFSVWSVGATTNQAKHHYSLHPLPFNPQTSCLTKLKMHILKVAEVESDSGQGWQANYAWIIVISLNSTSFLMQQSVQLHLKCIFSQWVFLCIKMPIKRMTFCLLLLDFIVL